MATDPDELTPEQFIRETSAVLTRPTPPASRDFGPAGFRVFVDEQLSICRRQLRPDSDFPAQAVLGNSIEERQFLGEGDEFPDDFARRLQREATAMAATRCFVAIMGPVPVVTDGGLDVGLCWTASHREMDERRNEAGIIFIGPNGCPYREATGTVSRESDPFRCVLEDPAI